MRGLIALLAACMTLTTSLAANASLADAPGDQLEVALVTYGPGTIYWERFGHDAIELRDRASGEAVAFNYGMFDFSQKNFLLNFARGRMRYTMDAVRAEDDIAYYAGEGRAVRRQMLALTPAQAAGLRDALRVNLEPANAPYDYDYFRANCATRVRDALDAALGGQLRTAWQGHASPATYRSETDRLMAPQAWLMLLMDLGLGPAADQPLDTWRANFVPMRLADAIATVRVDDGAGSTRPLVTADDLLAPARLTPPPAQAPGWRWRFLVIGLALGALLACTGRSQRPSAQRTFRTLATTFVGVAGIAGGVMLLLWLATAHHAAWANQNLLLLNPLAFGLVPAIWRGAGRRSRGLLLVIVVFAVAALAGKTLGLPWQHNLQWIALVLPLWAGLAVGLWHAPRAPSSDCQRA